VSLLSDGAERSGGRAARGGRAIVEVRAFPTPAGAAEAAWELHLVAAALRFAGDGWQAYELPCGGARAVAGRLVITVLSGTDDSGAREAVRRIHAGLFDAISAEQGRLAA
jgi:hypothetical protein